MAQRTMSITPTLALLRNGALPAATGVSTTNLDQVKVLDLALKLSNLFIDGGALSGTDTLALTIVCDGSADG